MSETYDRLLIFRYMIDTGHSFQTALNTAKRPMKVPSVRNEYKSEQFLGIIDDLKEEDSDNSSDSDDGIDDATQLDLFKRAEEIFNERELIEQVPTPPTDPPPPNTRRVRRPPLHRGEPKSAIERFLNFDQEEKKPTAPTLRSTTAPEEELPKYTE